jgi:hypothetical protein
MKMIEPRAGWDVLFKEMRRLGEDILLISDNIDQDFEKWEW